MALAVTMAIIAMLVVKAIMAMLAIKAVLASPPPKQLGPQPLPPLGRGGHMFPFRKYRCILMIYRKTGVGLRYARFPSPLFRGGPGGARTREIACFFTRKPLQNTRNGGVGRGPGGARTREIEAFRVAPTHYSFLF